VRGASTLTEVPLAGRALDLQLPPERGCTLAEYRRVTGIPARLVVVGMTATGSTLGDPQDAGVLDVVGLSTDKPRLMANLIRR
jgi:60 kDa SS-A/Ro ribonucleoprotein